LKALPPKQTLKKSLSFRVTLVRFVGLQPHDSVRSPFSGL
jgi:hypothetical protein